MSNSIVKDFQIWFDAQSLVTIEWVEKMIEKDLASGNLVEARALIDWVHGFWARYHSLDGTTKSIHIAGPYCRVSRNGYSCRVARDLVELREAEEDSTPDESPATPEDAS